MACLHWWIFPNIKGRNLTNSVQNLPENRRDNISSDTQTTQRKPSVSGGEGGSLNHGSKGNK